MTFFNNNSINNNLSTATNNNSNNENDAFYKLSLIIIFLVVVAISTIILVNINVKKVEKKIYVYPDKKANLTLKDIHISVVEKGNIECSKRAICTISEEHKLKVNINGKIYKLDANKKKYQKISGTKKFIYADINKNRIEVGIARNYTGSEVINNIGKFIYEKISNFFEKIGKWMNENINWTKA